jgi:hypothetical protein
VPGAVARELGLARLVGPIWLCGLLCAAGTADAAGPSSPTPRAPTAFQVPAAAQIPASEPPPAGEIAAAEAPARRRLQVTVIPLSQRGAVPEETQVALLRGMGEALRRNERLDMKDLDVRLSDFAQEVPLDQIDLARSTLQKGLDALGQLELEEAVGLLQDAVDHLVVVLPYIKKQELADAMVALASAHAQQGRRRASNAVLIRLLTWRADYEIDPQQYPPAMVAQVEEARRAVMKQARGEVRVESEPPGAQVFVDGRYVGVTPVVATDLLVGEHFVTFKKLGYKKGLRVAQVSARAPGQVSMKLQQSEKYLLVTQALSRLERGMGGPRLDPAMDTLKETLYLDHALFVRLVENAGKLGGVGYLYDVRTRALIKRQDFTLQTDGEAGRRAGELAEGLYNGVDYDGILKPPPEPPPPPPVVRQPLYKKWWFLTAAGAIAAGVVGMAVGIGVTRPKGCEGICSGAWQY